MEVVNKQICRLCLEVILDGDCEVIEEGKKEILDILLINIDFDISDNAVACKKCLGTLQNCFDFKSNCFYVNDYIAPFVEGEVKVDIKNVFGKVIKTNENLHLGESQICRLCMSFIEDEAFDYCTSDLKDGVFLEDMIGNCLPEVNLNSVDEPLVCKLCLSNIIRYYEFMKSCKEVEQNITNHFQGAENQGIASKVILEDVLELKNYDTLCKPIKKEILDVENVTKYPETEKAVDIKCEEIEIKDEFNNGVEASEAVKSGNGYTSKKYGSHSDDKVCACTLCSFVTDSKLSLKAHLTKVHRGATKAFGCHECPFETDYKSSLKQHLIKHKDKSEVEMQKCLLCPYETKYKSALFTHQKLEHSENVKMYKCERCSFSTKLRVSLVGHQLLHKNLVVSKFKCEKCPYQCKRQCDLLRHMRIHFDKQPFSCDQCTYSSNFKESLHRHKRVHQKDGVRKMYKCKLCDYQAKYSDSIKYHMTKIHMDPSKVPMLKCALCPYENTIKKNLYKHITRHYSHKDQPMIKCALCLYMTNKKEHLRKHMLIHQEATIKCDQCDFRTKHKECLRSHMQLHSSVKPPMFKCDKCEYSTWQKSNLRHHKVTHMELGETTAYKCSMCAFQTKYKHSLKDHTKACLKRKEKNGKKKKMVG